MIWMMTLVLEESLMEQEYFRAWSVIIVIFLQDIWESQNEQEPIDVPHNKWRDDPQIAVVV